jgi:hypothetical protein
LKARIKKNAPEIFLKKELKTFKRGLPETYKEYYRLLKELAGKILEVDSTYGDRVVLKYPKAKNINGLLVTGIDLDRELVDFI